MNEPRAAEPSQTYRLRLNTLIRLRWLAIIGQSAAVLLVAYGLNFPLPVAACFGLIAASAWLNLYLTFRYPTTQQIGPREALIVLSFDSIQLAGLLYLTGGLTNPFALLMTVPVVISATSMPLRLTAVLGVFVIAAATLLAVFHHPLPWRQGEVLELPLIYVFGLWLAVLSSITFTALYAFRVAAEGRLLANALSATELVLQREQHLSALDGLAAAAAHELGTPLATITLVAREMEREVTDPKLKEDVSLLRSQSERCRQILKRLTSLSSESESHMARLPLTSLIEEATAPHRDFDGITIKMESGECIGPEPVGRRNPGVIYGLGNLIENGVDFAKTKVKIGWRWNDRTIEISILDDGNGFPPEIIDRIGEPYMSHRPEGSSSGGGLGLGLFIAKTLLERSGATVVFSNASNTGEGALITISWPRGRFLGNEDDSAQKAQRLDVGVALAINGSRVATGDNHG